MDRLLPLIKKLSVTDTHWQRKNHFSTAVSLGIVTKSQGRPRAQQQLANTKQSQVDGTFLDFLTHFALFELFFSFFCSFFFMLVFFDLFGLWVFCVCFLCVVFVCSLFVLKRKG